MNIFKKIFNLLLIALLTTGLNWFGRTQTKASNLFGLYPHKTKRSNDLCDPVCATQSDYRLTLDITRLANSLA